MNSCGFRSRDWRAPDGSSGLRVCRPPSMKSIGIRRFLEKGTLRVYRIYEAAICGIRRKTAVQQTTKNQALYEQFSQKGIHSGCHKRGRFSRGAVSHLSPRKFASERFQVVSDKVPMRFRVSRDRQEKSELNKSKKKQVVRPGGSKKSWCRN